MQGTNRRTLIYIGITWLGISTVLFMLLETIISLLSSAVLLILLILLIWYIRREPSQKPTTKITNDDKITKINYYCLSCGTKHTEEKCPQCASEKKKVGFYISYLIPISSLMIDSGL
jgi:hypothetical protein